MAEEILKHDGKAWKEMTFPERAKLWKDDEDKARAMREQAEERPWVGKTFGEMSVDDKQELAARRPSLYRKLRDEWNELMGDGA